MGEIKRALLVVNVGTPDSPDIPSVRKYLRRFLNDRQVIDIPWLSRKILVNLIIIPFRVRRSSLLYRRLWTPQGSPLLIYLNRLVEKLNRSIGDNYFVAGAVRYGNPSIDSALSGIAVRGIREVVLLPLYPQYTTSTTKTVTDYVKKRVADYGLSLAVINQFCYNGSFLRSVTDRINEAGYHRHDHILFSYHGLPVRQVKRVHPEINYSECICENEMPLHGHTCYRAACYETTRRLAGMLGLREGSYTTGFQSRMSKNWMEPFSDEIIVSLARMGIKRLLVVAPSFVADCLETKIEIGEEYSELFIREGGEELTLAESLNDSDSWVSAIGEIIKTAVVQD